MAVGTYAAGSELMPTNLLAVDFGIATLTRRRSPADVAMSLVRSKSVSANTTVCAQRDCPRAVRTGGLTNFVVVSAVPTTAHDLNLDTLDRRKFQY